jgi:cellulose synthase/poly-beta-1,6-N-acetylglucosamine synthase-like glycosyltransferase
MTLAASRRPIALPCWVVILGTAFAVWRGSSLLPVVFGDSASTAIRLLLAVQWLVEAVFAYGIAGTTMVALAYLLSRRRQLQLPTHPRAEGSRIAILYLCCGDLDREAVLSLLRLRHAGPLELWIHDDLPGGDRDVDTLVAELAGAPMPIRLLRRPEKGGGKPGAINHVLDQVASHADFVLLCDNDSIAVDVDSLAELLAPMADPDVAVVQARNVPILDVAQCTLNRTASRAVNVFDLFLQVGSRFAWMPFVGHNALLRVEAVRAVGGMQPGCFADDIDLTLRLQLAGHTVHYAQHVPFGERHPPSYAAFRKRAYKWACGSVQVLRNWTGRVLRSPRLSVAEKWGYLQFLGFFPLQALALVYTVMTFLIAPFVLARDWSHLAASMLAGSVLPILIFLPVLVFALRERWARGLPSFLVVCWACYGAADIPTARGVLHGLSKRPRRWVPTNSVRGGADRSMLAEAVFGAAILVVPLRYYPELLLSPLTFLVAAKFLLIPTIGELYQDGVRAVGQPRRLLSRLPGLLRIGAALSLVSTLAAQAPAPAVEVRDDQLLVAGKPWVVKGVHYGPWRPGTGPGRSPYPTRAQLDEDMALVADLHANTILAFDVPVELLDAAHARGVRVLCGFWLEWPQFGTPPFAAAEAAAVAGVGSLHQHPAVLGWVLGNEIPSWVVTQHGAKAVEQQLRALRERLRAVDPVHPVTHANWPTTRSLDLSFLDLCSFNVYALWPPEVVARGYGNFVREVLRPLAKGKPLLITEYGANALEAGLDGQARLAMDCWRGLRGAGAIGGFAFAFADEWWKNYSNPKLAGAWWDRDTDLDDHLRHDEDPEEHYGLFDGLRQPKPASATVRAMYSGADDAVVTATVPTESMAAGRTGESRPTWLVAGFLAGAALLYFVTAAMRKHDRLAAERLRPPPQSPTP